MSRRWYGGFGTCLPEAKTREGTRPLRRTVSAGALALDDATSDLLDRWHPRLKESLVSLELPAENANRPTVRWVFVGSSSADRNEAFLRKRVQDVSLDEDYLEWMARPWSVPAYWRGSTSSLGHAIRLPFELGPRSWGGDGQIPENLTELVPLIKIGVLGDVVLTSLGLEEDLDYELPASLVPHWPPELDAWAQDGALAFAHQLFAQLAEDLAWAHTAIQTLRDPEWTRKWARSRLEGTIITEAHLAELRIQRETTTTTEWFGGDPIEGVDRIDRLLRLASQRLVHARELERDEVQLGLLEAAHALAAAEQQQRSARERDARSTERLTRTLTIVSVLFLPASVTSGILGANWSESPLPGGWLGLSITLAVAVVATILAGLGVLLLRAQRDERAAETDGPGGAK
jgi:hypothetical protein